MRRRPKTEPVLSPEQGERLSALLAAVPADADDHDPALLVLLEAWDEARVPYSPQRVLQAYRCRNGSWLVGDVQQVLSVIRRVVGP